MPWNRASSAQAIHDGLTRGDLSSRAFRRFDARQRARYQSFRRFVRGFYTPAFRDLFFRPEPPREMFRSVVTTLAGHWRPPLMTRAWIALFFAGVWLQKRIRFAPSHVLAAAEPERASASAAVTRT